MFDWLKRTDASPEIDAHTAACSFCGKGREHVAQLLAGPNVRLGRPREAQRVLASIEQPGALHRVLLGDAKEALGHPPLAVEHWRAAAESPGPYGELARRRLGASDALYR